MVEELEMTFPQLTTYGLILTTVLTVVQTYRLNTEQVAYKDLQLKVAKTEAANAKATLKAEGLQATKEHTHAASTQKVSDEFTTSQPIRDAIARSDLARSERLRLDADRRAATYRAQALGNAAACSSLADRLEAFDRQLVEGTQVFGDLGAVVARRDSEVVLLRGVIDADRAMLEANSSALPPTVPEPP